LQDTAAESCQHLGEISTKLDKTGGLSGLSQMQSPDIRRDVVNVIDQNK